MLICSSQGTPEWEAARKGRITASIAAACLGLCPYSSRQKAYRTILGTEPNRDNKFMAYGRGNEHRALDEFTFLTRQFVEPAGLYSHDDYDYLGATPDGLVGDDGLIECKCPETLPSVIPVHHKIQCLMQLACTGRQKCYYLAWTPNGHYLTIVHRQGIDGLINRLNKFYFKYILAGVEPERKKPRRRRKEVANVVSGPVPSVGT